LIEAMKNFIRQNGLFLERGEISEIQPAFTSAAQIQNDRAKEEWLANLIPMVTTRSFSFRVSAIGQVYRELSEGKTEVVAESSIIAIYGLRPIYGEEREDPVAGYDTGCLYRFPDR